MVTDSSIAYFIAMFIVFVIATSFSIGWAKADGIKPITDKFELGYIEDLEVKEKVKPEVAVVVKELDEVEELKRKVQIAKLKRELAELEKPVFNNDLFNDCVDILAGLGVPKRKAKAEAQVIFEKYPDIKDHNDFIERYGKK